MPNGPWIYKLFRKWATIKITDSFLDQKPNQLNLRLKMVNRQSTDQDTLTITDKYNQYAHMKITIYKCNIVRENILYSYGQKHDDYSRQTQREVKQDLSCLSLLTFLHVIPLSSFSRFFSYIVTESFILPFTLFPSFIRADKPLSLLLSNCSHQVNLKGIMEFSLFPYLKLATIGRVWFHSTRSPLKSY